MVFWGLALRAYLGLKHRHMAHFWEGVGYLGGLVGILALAASYLGNLQAGGLSALMYLGFGVFLLSILMSRIWLMLPEIFTQAGHILSHIRIYAVGAAGGILAGLLTDVGFAMAERLGLLGVLLGLLVAGVLHLLILLLTTLGHMLQPIRLIWVEFFTKFDPAHTGGLMLCVLIGAVVTMIVQSSSATVGLTMTLATQGLISLPAAIALVLGENIGTTITAQLATIGSGNVNSYRAANAHTLFNVLGVILVTAIFPWFLQAVDWVTITLMHAPANTMVDGAYPHAGRFVANAHTLFNVLNAVIFLTFFPILIKVTLALSPKDKEAGDPLFRMPQFDQRTLDNPVAAMAQVRGEISHMAEVVRAAYCNAIESIMQHDHKNIRKWQRFERHIDEMHKTLMLVLTQIMQSEINEEASQEISEQIRIINNLERIGDAVEIIAMLGEDIMDKDIPMSPQSWEDLQTMREKVGQFLDLIRQGLRTPPANFLEEAEILEASIDALRENIRCAYIERLKNAQCSVEGGTIFMNMITRMEKIGDCCFTIARAVTRQV
jgi:phosphate:Na+ symporter